METSLSITTLEIEKIATQRHVYDKQNEQLAVPLREALNMVFWGKHRWARVSATTNMLHVIDRIADGLEGTL